jgi:RNA polymerase sigma-70 factor (ECF subfamily)
MALYYSTYSDQQLVQSITCGEEGALRELFDRHWLSLFNKAHSFLGNEDAAKDCVQEVFIWLWLHREEVRIGNVSHYLYQAVRYRAFSALRSRRAAVGFEERVVQLTERILVSDELEYRELKAFLEKLVASLPEDQRLIFRLHREESLTYKEIADRLGISVKTVEKKMTLSLKYLRANAGDALVLLTFICLSK